MPDDPLVILREIAADPYVRWPDHYPDRRAIGTLCTYAPVEVLHAAGFVPIRLTPVQDTASGADRHLQTYACTVARGVLAAATAGRWDWLAGVVFPHTCDTIQALADVWRESRPAHYVGTLVGPVSVEFPTAEAYLTAELRRFVAHLEAHFRVTVDDTTLRASIRTYNENRRLLMALRETLPYSDWLRTSLAGLAMPVEEHTRLLTVLIEGFPRERKPSGPRVLLVGAVLDDPALPAFVEELGGRVVDDDLCTGRRNVETLIEEDLDPIVALVRRELHRPPCPARYAPGQPRPARLLHLVQESQADGVVLVQQKFCEPHAFDLPPLRAALDKAEVPHTTLEMEGSALDGALRTRIQAFLEMIE